MKNTEDILKIVSGETNPTTEQSVLLGLNDKDGSRQEYNHIKNAWALLASENRMSDYRIEGLYKDFQKQINSKKRLFKLKTLLKYAAIFILTVGISLICFYQQNDGFVAKTSKSFNTSVVAENGQQSKVVLPDSSVVLLNSGTQLTYNSNFGYTNRDIILTGQAFFHVTKNKILPFVVSCNEIKIKVFGTRFDVNAYPSNKNIKVSLQSGSVELLNSKKNSFHYNLVPGEMAQFDKHTEKIVINKVNIGRVIAWTDGIIYFNNSPMREVLIHLERKYNIEIKVNNHKIFQSVFTAKIKNQNIEEIFKSIDYSCSVNSRIIKSDEEGVKTKVFIN